MNKHQLIGEIMALATMITESENIEKIVFVEYSAHVNWMEVSIRASKQSYDTTLTYDRIFLDRDDQDYTINKLKKIKHHLVNIARTGKINFANLPYEIKEVKNYSLV